MFKAIFRRKLPLRDHFVFQGFLSKSKEKLEQNLKSEGEGQLGRTCRTADGAVIPEWLVNGYGAYPWSPTYEPLQQSGMFLLPKFCFKKITVVSIGK